METLDPSHYQATRAAGMAQDYFNYKLGGPYRIFEQQKVTKASKQTIVGVGNKYFLEFPLKDALSQEPNINCTVEVLYYTNKPQTPPEVTYTLESEPPNTTGAKDHEFYTRMKNRSEPLAADDIPDKYGNVPPNMEPVLHLAVAASGCIKWQNATEETFYRMAVIKSVKQVPRDDDFLEFDCEMLIHQMITQEMERWLMKTLWSPTTGIYVKNYQLLPKINM